jgi:hypothetical protein
MTSENQSGRRPPTIDLTATEVENPAAAKDATMDAIKAAMQDAAAESANAQAAEAAEAAKDTAPEHTAAPSAERPDGRAGSYLLTALVGGFVIAAIAGALWYKGFIPGREAAPPLAVAPSAGTSAEISDLAARLDKIESALKTQHQEPAPIPAAVTNRLTATEAQNKSLVDSLTALNKRVDDVAAASQNAAKQAGAATAAANAAKDSVQNTIKDSVKDAMRGTEQNAVARSDVDALAERITALENAVKALSEKETHADAAAPASDQALRLAVAASALRGEVERGAPYQTELAAAKIFGADQDAVAALEPFAATGVPSAQTLASGLAALVPELRRSADVESEATFLSRLEGKLIRFTPINAPAGNDPAAVIARIAIDAAHADIAAAVTDIANLPEKAKPLAADWLKKAQARDAAVVASRRIAADALTALSKPGAR